MVGRNVSKVCVFIVFAVFLLSGCGGKGNKVMYDPSTGKLKVPGAEIVWKGETFFEETTITEPSLVAIKKGEDIYFWFTEMGNVELNERASVQAVIQKIFYLYSSSGESGGLLENKIKNYLLLNPMGEVKYDVGISLEEVGNNEYKIKNTLGRLAAFKSVNNNLSIKEPLLLEPVKLFNPDFIGLITNWKETSGKIILYSPSTTFVAYDSDQIEIFGSIARLAFTPAQLIEKILFSYDDIHAAILSDAELFSLVNAIDSLDVVLSILGDLLGMIPALDCLESILIGSTSYEMDSLYNNFRNSLIKTNSTESTTEALSNLCIGAVKSMLTCLCTGSIYCEIAKGVLKILGLIPDIVDITISNIQAFLAKPYEKIDIVFSGGGGTGQTKPRAGVDISYSNFYPNGSLRNVSTGNLNLKWSISNVRAWGIATGDINHDGKIEIVVVDNPNRHLKAFSYNGSILWDVDISSKSNEFHPPILLEDVTGDGIPEILVGYRDTADILKVDVYKGDGSYIKTLNAGQGGYDSICAPFMVKGDMVFIACIAGYSCSPRGLKALSYSTGNVVWEYIKGTGDWGNWYSVGDIGKDGVLDISIPSGTPHNGCYGQDTNDDQLYSIVVKEDGSRLFSTLLSTLEGVSHINGSYSQKLIDLNGDGNPEVIGFEGHQVPYYPGTNKILLINSSGTAIVRTWNGPSNGAGWFSSIVDINRDGKKEIVASTYYAETDPGSKENIYIISYDLTSTLYQSAGAGVVLGTNDIDGDGQIEIIVLQNSTKKIRVLNPDLSEQWNYQLGAGEVWWFDFNFAISDLDGNGINEIIIAPGVSTADSLYVLEPQ